MNEWRLHLNESDPTNPRLEKHKRTKSYYLHKQDAPSFLMTQSNELQS